VTAARRAAKALLRATGRGGKRIFPGFAVAVFSLNSRLAAPSMFAEPEFGVARYCNDGTLRP
jgi:hypothetical protein